MDDWNLLDAYARNGSEPAFRQLVERHLGLVHTAALRQVHDPGLAEDIAQAVFVLLARKAPSFNRKVILAGWLFRTTRFLAGQARRTEERRRRREQEAHAMHPAESNDPSWSQIAPELDTALDSLRPDDREAVLLRFAEDRSHREIGERLGLNEASARKRVTRAVHRLRQILLARGLAPTLSLTALSALLAERLVAAPPPDLAHRISTTASASATPLTNTAPAVSPTTQLLVQQTLDAWRRAWTTKAFAVAGAIGIVALAILTFRLLTPAGLPGPTPSPPATTTVASASGSTAPTPPNPRDLVRARHAADTFELRVVDADTDTPIPAAHVPVRYVVGGEWISRTDLVTDAHGLCRVPIPQGDLQRFDAGAHAPGWENRFTTWRNDWPFPRPARHTLRLRRADILGGRVTHAATGQPVPGATVWIDYKISDTNWREPAEDVEREGSFQRLPLGLTDADGRWTCTVLPPSRAHAWITLEHPDCVPTSVAVARPSAELPPSESWTQLVTETHVAPLQPGFRVEGHAVDPENQPARRNPHRHDLA
jgi:RNA polymerase sigma factor (sigma-70 family)